MTCEVLESGEFQSICAGTGNLGPQFKETRCTESSKTPNYYEKKLAGEYIPMLPYYKARFGYSQELFESPKYSGFSDFNKCFGGGGPVFTNAVSAATDQAVTKAYASLQRLQTANLGVTVAEGKESAQLILNSAKKLASAMTHLKKGQFNKIGNDLGLTKRIFPPKLRKKYRTESYQGYKKVKQRYFRNRKTQTSEGNLTQAAADMWLELEFGWKPILQDIHDLAETLANMQYKERPPLFRFVGHGESPVTEGSFGVPAYNDTSDVKGTVYATIILYYRINNIDEFNSSTFGLKNPAAIAWELVPYSFVVDWILPVGNWLESISAENGLKRVDGCLSVKKIGNSLTYSGTWVGGKNFPVTYETFHESFRRTVPYSLPSYPPLPTVDLSDLIDGWKITTGLALIKSSFSYR